VQDVEAAVGVDRRGDHRLHRGGVADVGNMWARNAACSQDLVNGRVGGIGIDVVHEHARAGTCEPHGAGAPDARTRARDDRDSVLELLDRHERGG
jgi:hypothetical protein